MKELIVTGSKPKLKAPDTDVLPQTPWSFLYPYMSGLALFTRAIVNLTERQLQSGLVGGTAQFSLNSLKRNYLSTDHL